MIVDEKHESVLKMKKLMVDSFDFSRTLPENKTESELEIKRTICTAEDGTHQVRLVCMLCDIEQSFSLRIVLSGYFVLEPESTIDGEDTKADLIKRNTVAIMFPFLRSQVTLLTSQPDITPVVLPVLNINNLLDD